MLKLNSLMIGTLKPEDLASFYTKIFQRPADMQDAGWYGWQISSFYFTIGEHSEMKGKSKDPGRVMFNLQTRDVEGEFERIKVIDGVNIIKKPYEMAGGLIATFADPDGNYFQLMTPWDEN